MLPNDILGSKDKKHLAKQGEGDLIMRVIELSCFITPFFDNLVFCQCFTWVLPKKQICSYFFLVL